MSLKLYKKFSQEEIYMYIIMVLLIIYILNSLMV